MRYSLRKPWVLLTSFLLLVVLVVLGFLGYSRINYEYGDRITERNCSRIKKGMREKQIEKILGEFTNYWHDPQPEISNGKYKKYWQGQKGRITIQFDEDGRVIAADFDRAWSKEGSRRKPGLFDPILDFVNAVWDWFN